MQYKFDPHMHTAETSKCGRIPAERLVETYHALGYAGIAITDHLHAEYIDLLYCRDDWDTCVDRFLDGYKRAKTRGDALGLDVVLGCELRFQENENDYLVYGIDEGFLRKNPYLFRMGPEAFFERFKDEVLIIHAHPFREGNEFVRHNCVHGLEIVNAHPGHKNFNARALALAKEHPHLYRMCGSDAHRNKEEGLAWVLFDERVRDSKGLKAAVERGAYRLGCTKEEDEAILREAEDYFARI